MDGVERRDLGGLKPSSRRSRKRTDGDTSSLRAVAWALLVVFTLIVLDRDHCRVTFVESETGRLVGVANYALRTGSAREPSWRTDSVERAITARKLHNRTVIAVWWSTVGAIAVMATAVQLRMPWTGRIAFAALVGGFVLYAWMIRRTALDAARTYDGAVEPAFRVTWAVYALAVLSTFAAVRVRACKPRQFEPAEAFA